MVKRGQPSNYSMYLWLKTSCPFGPLPKKGKTIRKQIKPKGKGKRRKGRGEKKEKRKYGQEKEKEEKKR